MKQHLTKVLSAVVLSLVPWLRASAFDGSSGTETKDLSSEVATPQFKPPPGSYLNKLSIKIRHHTPKTRIYYTTDGTTPTREARLYTGSIFLNQSTTIKAIAINDADSYSRMVTATYSIVPEQSLATRTKSPSGQVTVTNKNGFKRTPSAIVREMPDQNTEKLRQPTRAETEAMIENILTNHGQ